MIPNQNIRQQEDAQQARLADSDLVDNFSVRFIEDSSDGVYSPRIITLDSSTDLEDGFHSEEYYSDESTVDYYINDDDAMLEFIQDSLSYVSSTDEMLYQRDAETLYRNITSSNVDSDSGSVDINTASSTGMHTHADYQNHTRADNLEISNVADSRSSTGMHPHADYQNHTRADNLEINNIAETLHRLQEQDDSDVVVIESLSLNNFLQRIDNDFMVMILNRMYMAYTLLIYNFELQDIHMPDINDSIPLADKIRGLSEVELKSLKNKVSKLLMADINDAAIVQSLVELISADKIDKIDSLHLRISKFTAVLYKDMLDLESKSCGICYCSFKPLHKCTSLRCWHTFHTKCIKKWVSVTWCCPLCRRKDIC